MLTKRYYVQIAGALNETLRETTDKQTVRLIAQRLADLFQRDNGRFDRSRFVAAVEKS